MGQLLKQRNVQRVTRRRKPGYPLGYDICVNGVRVGSATTAGAAGSRPAEPGWAVGTRPEFGLTLYNSWLNGNSHPSVTHAAETAIAYVKKCLREHKQKLQGAVA